MYECVQEERVRGLLSVCTEKPQLLLDIRILDGSSELQQYQLAFYRSSHLKRGRVRSRLHYINTAFYTATNSLGCTLKEHLEFPFSFDNETHLVESLVMFMK